MGDRLSHRDGDGLLGFLPGGVTLLDPSGPSFMPGVSEKSGDVLSVCRPAGS